ncbi:MAG: hypothetical protein HY226_06245 [Candidatus Vogelbacteria bacterium]|nr:hypothetical protein [Candidatus Vogelbacteria bacterium]
MLSFKRVMLYSALAATLLIGAGLWPDSFVRQKMQKTVVSETVQIPEWHASAGPMPVCDDLDGHITRVEEVTNQINSLADWSDVSSQDDGRVVLVMRRVGVLNNEREALYKHLDSCLSQEIITPAEHEFISTFFIAPAWRNLANASSRLDTAIDFRKLGYK